MAGIARYVAVLDACVLYPAPVRDLLLSLAHADLYHAKWSADIQREWVENLLRDRTDLTRAQLDSTNRMMARNLPDACVDNYAFLIPTLMLPDPDDRHVLAAAIKCNADAIVTTNLKDFPASALKQYGIEAQHPDDFVMNQIELSEKHALEAIKAMRARLKTPPKSPAEFILTIEQQQLPQTATYLREWQALI
jgi:predicted nucleic acid-binding protein